MGGIYRVSVLGPGPLPGCSELASRLSSRKRPPYLVRLDGIAEYDPSVSAIRWSLGLSHHGQA